MNEADKMIKELFTQEDINREYDIGYAQGSYEAEEKWKHKIKAKIEKLKKRTTRANKCLWIFR